MSCEHVKNPFWIFMEHVKCFQMSFASIMSTVFTTLLWSVWAYYHSPFHRWGKWGSGGDMPKHMQLINGRTRAKMMLVWALVQCFCHQVKPLPQVLNGQFWVTPQIQSASCVTQETSTHGGSRVWWLGTQTSPPLELYVWACRNYPISLCLFPHLWNGDITST